MTFSAAPSARMYVLGRAFGADQQPGLSTETSEPAMLAGAFK
jgi:hypothetical protein